MSPRLLAAALSALALIVAPPAAIAQSAGDDQYEDPFAGETPPSEEQEQPSPAEQAPDAGAAPASGAEGGAESGGNASGPAAARSTLPVTGADPGLIALAGSGLLLAGAGLRLRLRAHERDAA